MNQNEENRRSAYIDLIVNMLKRCDLGKVKIAYEFVLALTK